MNFQFRSFFVLIGIFVLVTATTLYTQAQDDGASQSVPREWRKFYSIGLQATFFYPTDWILDVPNPTDWEDFSPASSAEEAPPRPEPRAVLSAPIGDPLTDMEISIGVNREYEIDENQSLLEFQTNVNRFQATQSVIKPVRRILKEIASDALVRLFGENQVASIVYLSESNEPLGHTIYIRRGHLVYWIHTTKFTEESIDLLEALALTWEFDETAPATLDELEGASRHRKTIQDSIDEWESEQGIEIDKWIESFSESHQFTPTPTTDCAPTCPTATSTAMPKPTLTYNPTMAEQERIYNATLEATTPEPTPLPPYPGPSFRTVVPTPGSEAPSERRIYRGQTFYDESPFFELSYHQDKWSEGLYGYDAYTLPMPVLKHSVMSECYIFLKDSGTEAPFLTNVELANLQWSIYDVGARDGSIEAWGYATRVWNHSFLLRISYPLNADEATKSECRQEAEAVLDTFFVEKPLTIPPPPLLDDLLESSHYFMEGTIVDVSKNEWVVAASDPSQFGATYKVHVPPRAVVWNGDIDYRPLAEAGDFVSIHGTFYHDKKVGFVERAWLDLAKLSGPILGLRLTPKEIVLTTSDNQQGNHVIYVPNDLMVTIDGQQIRAKDVAWQRAIWVDFVGLYLEDGKSVRATRIWVSTASAAGETVRPVTLPPLPPPLPLPTPTVAQTGIPTPPPPHPSTFVASAPNPIYPTSTPIPLATAAFADDVLKGTIVEITDDGWLLATDHSSEPEIIYTIKVSPSSEVWKGESKRGLLPEVGDTATIRGSVDHDRQTGSVETAWLNIVRLSRTISNIRKSENEITFVTHGLTSEDLTIHVPADLVVSIAPQSLPARDVEWSRVTGVELVGLELKDENRVYAVELWAFTTVATLGAIPVSYPPAETTSLYVDKALGFSFEYPSNWFIKLHSGVNLDPLRTYELGVFNYEKVPVRKRSHSLYPGEISIHMYTQLYDREAELEAITQWLRLNYSPETKFTFLTHKQRKGFDEWRWLRDDGPWRANSVMPIIVKDGRIYVISLNPADSEYIDTLEKIVESFELP